MNPMDKLQETHDRLVAKMPEGVNCPDGCLFCSGEYASLIKGGSVGDTKTYTEEESQALIAAAVAEATAAAQSEIAVLKAAEEAAKKNPFAKKDDEEDKKDGGKDEDKEKTSLYAQVADLTSKLDTAVIEAESAKKERDELTSWLSAESDKLVAEAEFATRCADRATQVASVIAFPEDYVKERAEKWAALDDEQFAAQLEDYKLMAEKSSLKPSPEPLPRFTAMQAARETDEENTVVGSALKDLIRGRHIGVDPRAIR